METFDLGCIIMASGLGKRFGANKLLADFAGQPMVQKILDATASLPHRVVVTRHPEIAELCRGQNIPVLLHDLPNRNDTVRLGVEALGACRHYLFCPSDQPLLQKATLERLILDAQAHPEAIGRLCWEDTVGSPVIFPGVLEEDLKNLPLGKGGGALIKKHPSLLRLVPASDPRELMDVDTPEDLDLLLK